MKNLTISVPKEWADGIVAGVTALKAISKKEPGDGVDVLEEKERFKKSDEYKKCIGTAITLWLADMLVEEKGEYGDLMLKVSLDFEKK